MDHWYFAYGSNLLEAQMVARVGPIGTGSESPRIAHLPNYRVDFSMQGTDGKFYANLVQPGDGAIGVLYRCDEEALVKLDHFESGYVRRAFLVTDEQGSELAAIAYVARPERTRSGQPSAEYLLKIITGAAAHGLPADYVRALEATARR